MTNPCSSTTTTTTLDIRQILALLPHRYPFLLVDQVLEMDAEKKTFLCTILALIDRSRFFLQMNRRFGLSPMTEALLCWSIFLADRWSHK